MTTRLGLTQTEPKPRVGRRARECAASSLVESWPFVEMFQDAEKRRAQRKAELERRLAAITHELSKLKSDAEVRRTETHRVSPNHPVTITLACLSFSRRFRLSWLPSSSVPPMPRPALGSPKATRHPPSQRSAQQRWPARPRRRARRPLPTACPSRRARLTRRREPPRARRPPPWPHRWPTERQSLPMLTPTAWTMGG